MMKGVAPGIGKLTLAASLARVLESSKTPVDLFPEEQVFTRPTFAEVALGFRDKSSPTPEVFLPAYAATIDAMKGDNAWGIFDWNCAGMASDLPWAVAEPGRLLNLVRDVRALAAGMAPVLLFLQGDIREATKRAAAERGSDWVNDCVREAAAHGVPPGPDLERVVCYQEKLQPLIRADLNVLRKAGWFVRSVDAMKAPGEVLREAMAVLGLTPGM